MRRIARINKGPSSMGRRDFLRKAGAAAVGAAGLTGIIGPFDFAKAAIGAGERGIYITNIYRTQVSSTICGNFVRIETNKGIVGYGECRDLDDESEEWLGKLAPYIVYMNPTQPEKIYNAMLEAWTGPSQISNQEREGTGAISGIEMACWDIVGKVYNVPVYKLLGPRLRDKITMYADTDSNKESDIVSRIEKGFRHYKCDMYLSTIARGNYSTSSTTNKYGYREITINSAGLEQMHDYMEQYREVLQSFGEPYASAPIGSDHYQGYNATNQLSVESAIALADTLKAHNQDGYVEDIIDWWIDDCSGLPSKEVADATEMRLQTGEDMFGFEQFKPWADIGALDNFHPEPNTFGGLNQTLLAATYAHQKGIRTYFHNSSGPIAMAAYAHLAAVTPGFVALEYHHMDTTWHDDLIDGVVKPMIQDGYTFVPEGPGLGITLNDKQLAAHGASSWTKVI